MNKITTSQFCSDRGGDLAKLYCFPLIDSFKRK